MTRFGTWDTRGFGGANASLDPARKTEKMFNLFERRRRSAATLTGIRFPGDSFREYETEDQKWTLVIKGRTGIALNKATYKAWKEGELSYITPASWQAANLEY